MIDFFSSSAFMDSVVNLLADGLLQFSWWQVLLAALALIHVTIASVTIFLHRAQAHRAFLDGCFDTADDQ